MTADNVIGIFTSRAMKERGRYQIQFMKTRSSSGVGQKVDLEFNVDTLRITDLGEDEHESSLSQQKSNGSSIYQNLKRTSAIENADSDGVIPDPTKGSSVGKLKSIKAASDIRSMILANLNTPAG
jgi:hypothetical protein